MRLILLLFFSMHFFSCEMFEYNPNHYELEESEKNLTAQNILKISSKKPGDTLLIVFTGDHQRFYEETEAFVNKVNSRPPGDFVIISGDISDFGMPAEFRWMQNIYSNLNAPYLTVIGNHDHLGNGKQVYLEMFGPLDYSLTYGKYHFVFSNTNGREYSFDGTVPDIGFLRKQIVEVDDSLIKILVSHVMPGEIDFDPALTFPLGEVISEAKNFMAGFHGHTHNYQVNFPYGSKYPFVSSSSTSYRIYLEIRFYTDQENLKDTFHVKLINF